MKNLIFLKLGGSLITDKTRPFTMRADALRRIAAEIAAFRESAPQTPLLIGHGSGSFGHTVGKEYRIREGWPASGLPRQVWWRGFAETGYQAALLHRQVLDALHDAGLPVFSIAPSSGILSAEGQVQSWDTEIIRKTLQAGLLPVLYGDVVYDTRRGGTILSTEDLFAALTPALHPRRILLAGLEEGVWADYPACTRLIETITPSRYAALRAALRGSHGADVTGGMAGKVASMLNLTQKHPDLEVRIFSGQAKDAIKQALQGLPLGSRLIGYDK